MHFAQLIKISRPRFWLYLLGPYCVGLAATTTHMSWWYVMWGIYFLFPANLFLYGVNDIADRDTDAFNVKKNTYELRTSVEDQAHLWRAIGISQLPFIIGAMWLPATAQFALLMYLFLGAIYSLPPVRAKTRPLLDSFSNALYIMPGIFGYFLAGGITVSGPIVIAAGAWAMAMHAYSAIPDITADTQAKLRTIATQLGIHGTVLFCSLLYSIAWWLSRPTLGISANILGSVYGLLMLWSLYQHTETAVFRIYRWFPVVNTTMGAVLFMTVVAQRW